MNLKLKIAGNTLIQIIGKIISSGSSFLITLLIARNFGPSGFGDYEKIISFVAIFYLMVDFGLNAIALSEIKKDISKKTEFYGLILASRIILGFVLIFIAISLLSFLPYSENQGYTPFVRIGIIIAATTILLQGLTITNNLLFQNDLRYDKSVLAVSVGNILNLLMVFIIINLNFPLITIIIAYTVSSFFTTSLSFLLAKHSVIFIKPIFDFNKIKNLVIKTLPLSITLIFNVIYFRSDILILTALRPTAEVAFYGLAYRFFEVSLVFPTFFMNALYPALLDYKNQSKEKIKEIFFLAGGFLLGSGVIASIFMFFLAPWFISLTGSAFNQSILVLKILVIFLPVFFLTSLFMWVLVAFEKQKLLSYVYGFTMIINITLNFIFIPKYGYLSSAVITGVTELIVLILSGFLVFKFLKNTNTTIIVNNEEIKQ